jgi:hypothetical protein
MHTLEDVHQLVHRSHSTTSTMLQGVKKTSNKTITQDKINARIDTDVVSFILLSVHSYHILSQEENTATRCNTVMHERLCARTMRDTICLEKNYYYAFKYE